MKKVIYLMAIGLMTLPFTGAAQAGAVQREVLEAPEDIGDESSDSFKNSAFKIYAGSLKFRKLAEDKEVFTAESKEEFEKLKTELGELNGRTGEMLKGAKKIRPLSKIKTAIENTKAAINALNVSLENFDYVSKNMVSTD